MTPSRDERRVLPPHFDRLPPSPQAAPHSVLSLMPYVVPVLEERLWSTAPPSRGGGGGGPREGSEEVRRC